MAERELELGYYACRMMKWTWSYCLALALDSGAHEGIEFCNIFMMVPCPVWTQRDKPKDVNSALS